MIPVECTSPTRAGAARAGHRRQRLAAARVLVAGHTYALAINQQKLDALSAWCPGLGVLVPANWRYRDGLNAGRAVPVERGFDSFRICQAPVWRPGHVASYLFRPGALAHALREFRPHLVQVDQEVYSLAAAEILLAARSRGAKTVVFGWENLNRPLPPVQRAARAVVLALADGLVCGSREAAGLLRRWGFRRRIEVIPQLGVDTATFRRSLRRPGPRFTVGFVGRLVEEKGVDVLLGALAGLHRAGTPFDAVICGSGPVEQRLKSLAEEFGLAGRVQWLGTVPHGRVAEAMAPMDVLVLPSREIAAWKEQFGHVLIEAMAMAIPVVGSRSGAIPEVIGRDDLLFDENDAAGLSRILQRMAGDRTWRLQAGRYGYQRVLGHYTHARIAERLASFWADLLEAA